MKQILCFMICMVLSSTGLAAINTYFLELEVEIRGVKIFNGSFKAKASGELTEIPIERDQEKYLISVALEEDEDQNILMDFNITQHNQADTLVFSSTPKILTLEGVEAELSSSYQGKRSFLLKATPSLAF